MVYSKKSHAHPSLFHSIPSLSLSLFFKHVAFTIYFSLAYPSIIPLRNTKLYLYPPHSSSLSPNITFLGHPTKNRWLVKVISARSIPCLAVHWHGHMRCSQLASMLMVGFSVLIVWCLSSIWLQFIAFTSVSLGSKSS